jgi:hypothetical protein
MPSSPGNVHDNFCCVIYQEISDVMSEVGLYIEIPALRRTAHFLRQDGRVWVVVQSIVILGSVKFM